MGLRWQVLAQTNPAHNTPVVMDDIDIGCAPMILEKPDCVHLLLKWNLLQSCLQDKS